MNNSISGNTGKNIKIAIVDSGLDAGHPELKQYTFQGIEIREIEEGFILLEDSYKDYLGHGTAVTYLIKKSVPDAQIFMIKIFDEITQITSLEKYCAALQYVRDHLDADILHLSNGIVECDDIGRLKSLCNEIRDKGIIITAAFDNMGSISYPAAFENVIGVDWYRDCVKISDYVYVETRDINILGYGLEQKLPWADSGYRRVGGSSFSAPRITGFIAKIMEQGYRDFDSIKEMLKKNAMRILTPEVGKAIIKPHDIKTAVTFPFNKEIQLLARNEDMLDFKIAAYYEHKISRNLGRHTGELTNCSNEKVLHNYKLIDWEGDFDTVILGHLKEMSQYLKSDLIVEILQLCIKWNKNIFAFDDLEDYKQLTDEMIHKKLSVYYPRFNHDNLNGNPRGKLRRFGKPVICIAGTSSKQGKFTLQLALRREMKERGYHVGQLGTEPSSLLFGMDEVLPIGYGTEHMAIRGGDIIRAVNMLMGSIEDKNPDIILLGTQSHTIPYSMGNLMFYPIFMHEILWASEPDGVILCINESDDIEYIKRTIQYLESVVETEVIAMALSPLSKYSIHTIFGEELIEVDQGKLVQQKANLEHALGKQVYMINQEADIRAFVSHIEDFFI